VKLRVGGVLSLVLGGVLVTGGTLGLDAGAGTPPPSCGGLAIGTPTPTCPLGKLNLSETTTGSGTPPVGGWLVDIASTNCKLYGTAASTITATVPNNGSVLSDLLYQNTDGPETTLCSYTVTQHAVAGFTTTYDPAGPYTLPETEDNSAVTNVGVMNDSPVVVASPTPTPAAASPTPAPETSEQSTGAGGGAGGLPATGNAHARAEILAGVALCFLGFFLLFAGRKPDEA